MLERWRAGCPSRQPRQPTSTKDTQKLAAFVYGVSVYYMADELWECLTSELGRGRGFTSQIDSFNLGGDGIG